MENQRHNHIIIIKEYIDILIKKENVNYPFTIKPIYMISSNDLINTNLTLDNYKNEEKRKTEKEEERKAEELLKIIDEEKRKIEELEKKLKKWKKEKKKKIKKRKKKKKQK